MGQKGRGRISMLLTGFVEEFGRSGAVSDLSIPV